MKRTLQAAVLAASFTLAGTVAAQSPFGPQMPGPGQIKKCTKDYVASLDKQIESMEQWRTTAPETVGQICALIDTGSKLFGDDLPDGLKAQLKELLGVPIDLRMIKTQCRQSQGDIDREIRSQIGFLRSEKQRCEGGI